MSKLTQVGMFIGNKYRSEAGLLVECLYHKKIWFQCEGWTDRLVTMMHRRRRKRLHVHLSVCFCVHVK